MIQETPRINNLFRFLHIYHKVLYIIIACSTVILGFRGDFLPAHLEPGLGPIGARCVFSGTCHGNRCLFKHVETLDRLDCLGVSKNENNWFWESWTRPEIPKS